VSDRVACVIGWPVDHSRSPLIHRYWLKALSIDGDYVVSPVEPERIESFFAGFANSGFVGGNVTVPYKEIAYRAVDATDEVAAALGAVNTLSIEAGRLIGGNTDSYGFLANLDASAPGWDNAGEGAVVLGAGGASRAVVWSLLQRGLKPVVVVNRSAERAARLAAAFDGDIRISPWSELGEWLPRASLLVNATSLGMTKQPPLDVELERLAEGAVVSDLVYVPLETDLLAAARRHGYAAVGGLGMLIHQAVPGFEKWFGVRPEVTAELHDLLAADIAEGR
jgi:shikimate dehydrogenase